MMMKIVFFCSVLVSLCLLQSVSAGQINDLYQADVAAEGGNDVWQQQALIQVLIRVSGKADIDLVPEIKEESKRASVYIKQFKSVRTADGNRMRVLLDASKVNQLLQQHNIAVWGALRPDILVWQIKQKDGERTFVRRADQPLNVALHRAFLFAGLPLLQPLYDMDDLLNLSETDVWAGFWQQINQASVRYGADVILAVTVDEVSENDKTLLRLSWQRQDSGRTFRDTVTAADEQSLMHNFASVLASQLAERYATLMSEQHSADIELVIQNVTNLTDLVRVQQLLQQMVGVTNVTISRFETDQAYYRLQTNIGAEGLMNALKFNPQFKLKDMTTMLDNAALNTALQPVLASFEYIKP
ncbi:DUF2066 domain-containing protein [Rheinheimera baltica]|uniref:DUF2066 domain-containing protein n=2 Tax=Rheinheimera baltica TaxID=67576 RepID=UPI00273FA9C7|nr:DUF2066 domain-containing protein [Rheinheimera baltica]MDP5144670.1 DUF2066 domain-containing protein [Rheinheimera baltica]